MCSSERDAWPGLAEAVAAVADLAEAEAAELPGAAAAERLGVLRPLIDRLEAVSAGLVARLDASKAYQDAGARTAPAWLRRELRLSPGEAHRQLQLGRALPSLPQTASALAAGEITLAHARLLAAAWEQVGDEVMGWAEEHLVTIAKLVEVGGLREAVKQLREALDPDALERDYVKALGKRHVSVSKVGEGFALSGFLDPEAGSVVATALQALSRRRDADDERSSGKRRADALADLCRDALETDPGHHTDTESDGAARRGVEDHLDDEDEDDDEQDADDAGTGAGDATPRACRARTGTLNGARPHLSVVVDWSRLCSGSGADSPRWVPPARLEGFGPICDTLLRKLACDAGVSRVVTDPKGKPLNLGRTARTARPHQRRGLRVRDRGRCSTPGCVSTRVEIHHVLHWVDGGSTDVDQMVSACTRCHTLIHLGLLVLQAHGDGTFTYRDRFDRVLTDHDRVAEDFTRDWLTHHPATAMDTATRTTAGKTKRTGARRHDPHDLHRRQHALRL